MGMRKFGSAALPFSKVICAVKVAALLIIYRITGQTLALY